MVDFLKYWLAVVLLATGYAGFLLGGNWVWLGVGSLPILALLDTLIGPDYSMTKKLNLRLANIPIWICAAGPLWLYFVFAWRLPSAFLCFMAALVPPIWHELIIKPRLKIWDLEYATKEERVLAAAQNRAAGWADWFSETPLHKSATHQPSARRQNSSPHY